ncbi:nitronate monooxygenase [Actinokineospora sp. NBRC 105648]|uniref:nitronate monooxygenase n=1 Tax=Actinokineospora sp. NBRC 105648 TaxID=3032206 RepID=UPI0024A5C6B4|nr:nitronate monooxygenase [Actinokineospora sp. NBRC 105648]GLZ39638.1 2-nitropropane dioxygenase [Actinokineospora sp. NBRC 105648]
MLNDLAVPVIVAPMAGGPSTPALVAGAVEAGAFGFLAAGSLTADALRLQIEQTREITRKPFGVNIFAPSSQSTEDLSGYREQVRADALRYGVEPGAAAWDDDHFAAKVDVVVAAGVPVVSFAFGLPRPEDVRKLKDGGALVVITVTTPDEGRAAADLGADVLCVQGGAAGGHRSVFRDDPAHPGGAPLYDLLPALRLVGAATGLPLIAAGGLTHGADVAAVLAAGAVAAQLGTAFLRCPEAGTPAAHRAALAAGGRETALTRAFTGRPARGLVNRFMGDHPAAPSAYPNLHNLTRPIRAAAGQAGDPEAMSLWAGQAYSLAGEEPVADVLARLDAQAREAATALAARFGK